MRNASAVLALVALVACAFETESGHETAVTLGASSTITPTGSASTGSGDETTTTDDTSESTSTSGDADSTTSGLVESTSTSGSIPEFQYRRWLTFNDPPTNQVEDVIVRVSLRSDRMNFDNAAIDGSDIVFFAGDLQSAYAHEVEAYDGAESFAEIWVRVPRVGGGVDGFWMYYGATGPVEPSDAQAVWGQRFSTVFHMDDVVDATAAGTHGTDMGTALAVGKIGGARNFDGVAHVELSTAGLSTMAGGASFWFRRSGAVTTPQMMFFASSVATSYGFTPSDIHVHLGDYGVSQSAHLHLATASAVGSGAHTDDAWHLAFATWQNGAAARLYVDGAVVAQAEDAGPPVLLTAVARLGASGLPTAGVSENFAGQLDEFRILPVAPPIAWIELDYRSQADLLLSFGAEEPA